TLSRAALALAMLLAGSAGAATFTVDDDGKDCANAGFTKIGDAVAAASDGDQITVCAGTYAEQVVTSKSLRFVGKGRPLLRPGTLPVSLPSTMGDRAVTAALLVDTTRAMVAGFDVDLSAAGVADCGALLTGIFFRNASGVVQDTHVSGARVPALRTCDSGVGIYVESGVIGEHLGRPLLGKAKLAVKNSQFSPCPHAAPAPNPPHTTPTP